MDNWDCVHAHWECYQGEKGFSDCLLQQFILFSSPSPLFFCASCSGWQHVGSGDRPVPHAGGVHHVHFVWGELSSERSSWTLQRFHAASCRSSPEWRDLSRFILSPPPFFFFFLNKIYLKWRNLECVFWTRALKEHGHELQKSLIHDNMKHPAVYRALDRTWWHHSCIIVSFSCELTTPPPNIWLTRLQPVLITFYFPEKKRYINKTKTASPFFSLFYSVDDAKSVYSTW